METSVQTRDWRDPAVMEAELQAGYDPRLYFHPYEHARGTRDFARELGKWCAYEDVARDPDNRDSLNFYALEWAALGHDYGFYAWTFLPDEEKARYPSREIYAAAQTRRIMEDLDAPEEVISQVEAAIWSTELGVACTTREGRILRQADLANVGGPATREGLTDFFWSTVKLYREKRLLSGQSPNVFIPLEFISFCNASYRVLATYNAEDVSVGDFDRTADGRSHFGAAAGKMIMGLEAPRLVIDLARKVGCTLLCDLSPKRFDDVDATAPAVF